jgi:CBS domain-containing protein
VLTRHQAISIVDEDGKLAGIITRGDMLRAMGLQEHAESPVLEVGSKDPFVTYPDESVYDAVSHMLIHDIGRLPVVSRADPRQIVGYLGRAAILQARMRRVHEESVREPGWIKRPA